MAWAVTNLLYALLAQGSAFGVIRRVHNDVAMVLSGKHPVIEVWPRSHPHVQ